MGTVQKLAEKVRAGLQAAHPQLRKDGDQQAGAGGRSHYRGPDATHERTGECGAGTDRAAGDSATMAAAAIEESSRGECSDSGTIRPGGAGRSGLQRSDDPVEPGSNGS